MNRKKITLLSVASFISIIAKAQGDINAALTTATSSLKTIAGNVITLIVVVLAIAAVSAVLYVFYKIQKGDQDAWGKAQGWVVGLIFAVVALLVVKSLWLS